MFSESIITAEYIYCINLPIIITSMGEEFCGYVREGGGGGGGGQNVCNFTWYVWLYCNSTYLGVFLIEIIGWCILSSNKWPWNNLALI